MIPAEAEVLAVIREIAAVDLQVTRPIAASHQLIADLELDSINLVTLLTAIENHFRVALPRADSGALRTVEDLVEHVRRACGGGRR